MVFGAGFACVFLHLYKNFNSVKKILWLGCAIGMSLITLSNKHALYKWERCAQFLLVGYYLEFTSGDCLLFSVGIAPFLWYILGGGLIELAHYLHTTKYLDMRNTWKRIEILRERADINALFSLLLTKNTVENKYLGFQWKSILETTP
jgi:hypothetical protein